MNGAEWIRVPVGSDAGRWTTRRYERVALVVAHSVTALQRLLDVTPLFETDQRVQTVFTAAPGVFTAGVRQMLDALGAAVISWDQAIQTDFDVVIASGYTGLHRLRPPIVVIPHGAGYNKFVPQDPGRPASASLPVFGLSGQHLVRDGRVVPSTVVLSHEDDGRILKEHCPEALPMALVAGDPCLDRLLLSTARRAQYREGLGVDRRPLVVAASTWGPDSLFGASVGTLERLVDEARANDYAVAVLLHPSVWYGHGPRQVKSWFRTPRYAGVRLVDPDWDWRPYLISADGFIGDHGSVSLYAAAVGVPLLRTDIPRRAVVPDSAMELLCAAVPTVRPGVPILGQLADAGRLLGKPAHKAVVERIASRSANPAAILRREIYRHMRLEEPGEPAVVEPVPFPQRDEGWSDFYRDNQPATTPVVPQVW